MFLERVVKIDRDLKQIVESSVLDIRNASKNIVYFATLAFGKCLGQRVEWSIQLLIIQYFVKENGG
jgi:hypothetical protein